VGRKEGSIGAAAILMLLYLSLRVQHMKEMYELVALDDSEFKIALLGSRALDLDQEQELSSNGCLLFITRSEVRQTPPSQNRLMLFFHPSCDGMSGAPHIRNPWNEHLKEPMHRLSVQNQPNLSQNGDKTDAIICSPSIR
jgi:hypothetical protein